MSRKSNIWRRILVATGWGIGSLIALAVIAVITLSLYFNSERLTPFVEKYASRYMRADLKAGKIEVSLWSTFPHFHLDVENLTVISHTLDSIPPALRQRLPADCDTLARVRNLSGGINLMRLLRGEIALRNVAVSEADLNFVAAGDSTNNYDIIISADRDKTMRIPEISVNRAILRNENRIRYFSLTSRSSASIDIDSARLTCRGSQRNNYTLDINGKINAATRGMQILNRFPIHFGGGMSVAFAPFKIRLSDYQIGFGNIKSSIDLSMNMEESVSINRLSYHVMPFNLLSLAAYLPANTLSALDGLDSEINIEATAHLTKPYIPSTDTLPSFEIDLLIPDSDIIFRSRNGELHRLHHTGVSGKFNFNGVNPDLSYLEVPDFSLSGDGVDIAINALVTDIFLKPMIKISMSGEMDLKHIAGLIPGNKDLTFSGHATAKAQFRCTVPDLYRASLSDVEAMGEATVSNLSFKDRGRDIRINTPSARIDFGIRTDEIDRNYPAGRKSFVKAMFSADSVTAAHGPMIFCGNKITVGANVEKPDADSLRLKATLTAGSAKYAGSGFNLDLYDILAESNAADKHREWDIHSFLSASSGTASHLNCGQFCSIDGLDIEYTPQAIILHNITLRSGRSDISLQGSLADYKHPTAKNPLKIRLNSEIGTLDINELARTYKSHQSAYMTAVSRKTSTADTPSSPALSIPRCIDARIGIKAKETLYTNLRLFDLGTGINIRNGEAHIENLHASSDFGSAHLNLCCKTQDIQKMTLNTEISLDSINITRFFNAFHKLEEMMPVMKNLHGIVSAKVSGEFHIFPNMDIDIPSVQALVGIHGRDLRIHQSKFVRRITRMLLIPHSDDLNIHDMTVKAVVHDNMLELYPFIFQFAQYKIAMLGHNNFAGDLYYHIAVLHSPLPFRFGINIKGNMDRPELRFGGAGYNEKDAMKITSIVENKRINLVKEMGVYLNKFIDKAAEHRGD